MAFVESRRPTKSAHYLLTGFRRLRENIASLERGLVRNSPALAGFAAAGALLVGIGYGAFAAGGSDASGYISQARLWLQGDLHVPIPLSSLVWWTDSSSLPAPELVFSPLGYKPATVSGMLVPTYPPGLPMVMAVFQVVGGSRSVYYVVPLLGAVAVWLTYVVGRLLGDRLTAAAAAILMLASPAFLMQLVNPMSDVPVVAWWLAATWMAWTARALPGWMCAGLLVSGAIVTRPNLVPLAALFVVVPFLRERSGRTCLRSSMACAVGILPAIAFLIWLNTYLYGSPFESGYGSLASIYSMQNVLPNLGLYGGWLIGSQTPLILLGVAAPFFSLGGGTLPSLKARRLVLFSLMFSGILFGCYLPYQQFEEWGTLRFVLSAFPFLILLSVVVARAIFSRLTPNHGGTALVALTCILAVAGFHVARERSVFDFWVLEGRYVAAARWIEQQNLKHSSLPCSTAVASATTRTAQSPDTTGSESDSTSLHSG